MSAARDKDNRERKQQEGEKENIKGATPKKKSLELDNEVVSKAINAEEGVGKKGGIDMDSFNDTETKTSPPVKKKVKPKIKVKQRSKQDVNDQQPANDSNGGAKVNINTANNSTIPNDTSSSSSSKITSTNTNNNTNTKTTNTTSTTNTNVTATPKAGTTQQQDKMQKLSFLTDLYEQGYITVVEYKERKSQLIDELTGTKTRTRTNSHVPMRMYSILFYSIQSLFCRFFSFFFFFLKTNMEFTLHFYSHYFKDPPTVVASPPPDWSTIKEETAIKHVYDTQKNQWSTTVVKVFTLFHSTLLLDCFYLNLYDIK